MHDASKPCCAPSNAPVGLSLAPPVLRSGRKPPGLVALSGGVFLMGTNEGLPEDEEGPVREVAVAPFAISPTTVTNAQFATFVKATGYVTEAERFGFSFVFQHFAPDGDPLPNTPWWKVVEGATWRRPEGPRSDVSTRQNHPAVHVSWHDAQAYCAWAGARLPTEAEWEFAARGGLAQKRYPWGDELTPGGRHMANIWQGVFPHHNTAADGYPGTAPVKSFRPNGFGLYNMSGNVWEWCADLAGDGRRSMRGGSYLCHESYCNRYRVAARSSNTPDSSTGNIGFRVAANARSPRGEDR